MIGSRLVKSSEAVNKECAVIFFFLCSSINHGVDAIRRRNYKWQNINRPFITLLLIAGLIYPVIKALQGL